MRGVCRNRIVLAACLLLACSNSENTPAPPALGDLPSDSPNRLMTDYAAAWRAMDYAAYADRVLYDGELPAADGFHYMPFRFHYAGDSNQSHSLDDELGTARKMFSHERLGMQPEVVRIRMECRKLEDWAALPHPGEAWGDPYPAGTLRGVYETRIHIELDAKIPGTEIDHFDSAEPRIAAYAIPVREGGGVGWRLWKLHDLGEG